jgi:hypothetical protein
MRGDHARDPETDEQEAHPEDEAGCGLNDVSHNHRGDHRLVGLGALTQNLRERKQRHEQGAHPQQSCELLRTGSVVGELGCESIRADEKRKEGGS